MGGGGDGGGKGRGGGGIGGGGEKGAEGGGGTHFALKNKSHNKILSDQDSNVTAAGHQPIPE